MSAFKSLGSFVRSTAVSVLVVATILFAGNHIRKQFKDIDFQTQKLPDVEKTFQSIQGTRQKGLAQEYESQVERLRQASEDQIAEALEQLRREKSILEQRPHASAMSFLELAKAANSDQLRDAIETDIKLEALKQKEAALAKLLGFAEKAKSYNDLKIEVERLRVKNNAAIQQRDQNKRASERIAREHPSTYRIWPTPAYYDIEEVRAQWVVLNNAAWATYKDWKQKNDELESRPKPNAAPRFTIDQSRLEIALSPARTTIAKFRKEGDKEFSTFVSYLWMALYLVLLAMGTGVLLKAVLFFGLAPLATRFPQIVLVPKSFKREPPEQHGGYATQPFQGGVSLEMKLNANNELLVKPDYLQRVSAAARTTTQLLLNGRYPIASLASGMYLLTRVHPHADDTVVISSTKDALSKIASIELAAGENFVLQPQHLAGIVHPRNAPVHLLSLWRFGSLHAWLTLQFRYLVFQGPVTLVVKGCQGVRIEQAQSGPAISQAATIGFSANLGYSTVRSETFMAYLLGHKSLFNDRFSGDGGFFAYQEIPSTDQRSGVTGRSLQGLMDGLLKAFGI